MNDLDFGPHRRCRWCKQLFPHRRMLDKGEHWYCGLPHYLKQKEHDDEVADSLRIHPVDDDSLDI